MIRMYKPPPAERNTVPKPKEDPSKPRDRPWRAKKETSPFGLNKDDLEYLKKNTNYNEKEIQGWYKGFRADCPDGNLHKSKILEIYNMILPNGDSSVFVDQIFRIFDKDGNGYIDFKEFMLATDMTKTGTPEEKLKWAFKLYDKDGSGSIDLSEMMEAICTLYDMENVQQRGDISVKKAKRIFAQLDTDGNGELTMDEFVRGCLQDDELVTMLSPPPDDVDDAADDEEGTSLLDLAGVAAAASASATGKDKHKKKKRAK